ncbi:hypothetical protein [Sulfobacillus thermosulfidooxidans]|nr:hypothetical protein [Sulfobacillus thermosulfidooxidans]
MAFLAHYVSGLKGNPVGIVKARRRLVLFLAVLIGTLGFLVVAAWVSGA